MKKITALVIGFTGIIGSLGANADNAPAPAEALKQATGVATFIADGVNLRMDPSVNSPYLVCVTGDELYFDPESVQWSSMLGGIHIDGKLIQVDHEKIQGSKDMALPVLGSEGDWVKLYYSNGGNPFEVWTMKKFVKIDPLDTPTTSSTYSPSGYNALNLTGDADGSEAIIYQEVGMDEDEGFFLGRKEGKAIIFEYFLPMHIEYKPSITGVEISKDASSNTLIFSFGKDCKKGESESPILDISGFSADNIKSLIPFSQKLPEEEVLILISYPDGMGPL